MGNIAFVPEGDVFERGHGVAAQDAGEAAQFFAGDRVALVGHGGAAFLPGREILFDFEHFSALEVAELGGPAVDARPDEGDRLLELGVAVALDDLRGESGGNEAELAADHLFHARVQVGVGADGSREGADADAFAGLLEPFDGAAKFVIHERHLEAEGDRLGVDAVGAPDHRGELVFVRFLGDGGAERFEVFQEHPARFVHLDGERGVEDIRRGHPLVNPARGGPDVAGDVLQERDDVVIGAQFDFLDFGQFEAGFLADNGGVLFGDHADLGLRFASENLDFQPDFVFVLLVPEGAHLWKGITVDHAGEDKRPGVTGKEKVEGRRENRSTPPLKGISMPRQQGGRQSSIQKKCPTFRLLGIRSGNKYLQGLWVASNPLGL